LEKDELRLSETQGLLNWDGWAAGALVGMDSSRNRAFLLTMK
jgi:hypothetical protein